MAYPTRVWRSGGPRNCFACGDSGHLAKNCPLGKTTYEDVTCYLCGEKGHKKRDCPTQQSNDGIYQNGGIVDGTVKQKQQRESDTRSQQREKQRERETGQWGGAGRARERGGALTYRQQEGRWSREAGQARPTAKDISCFLCGEKGHKKRDCPQQGVRWQNKDDIKSKEQGGETKYEYQTGEKMHTSTTGMEKADRGIENAQAVSTQPTTGIDFEHLPEPDEGDIVKSKNDVTINKPTSHSSSFGDQLTLYKGPRRNQSGRGPTPGRNDHQVQPNSDRRYRSSGRSQFSEFASLPCYVDTHCHIEYVLERSFLNRYGDLKRKFGYPDNFRGCITSFCDPPAFSSFGLWKELLEEDGVWGTFGVHPRHARAYTDKMEEAIITCLTHSKCVGFGEMGLDYSDHCINESPADVQNQVLKRLLRLAPVMGKPLVLHCRDAEEDLLECLTLAGIPSDWKIHLHCYSGSLRMARRFLDAFPNLYFGFTGQITYRKSEENRAVAAELPANRILLETDSPYLTPASFKDKDFKNCHPPMAGAVARVLARARDEPVDRMMSILQENCAVLYGV